MFTLHFLNRTKKIWLMPCLFMAIAMLGHHLFIHYANHLDNGFIKQWGEMELISYLMMMCVCGYGLFIRIIEKALDYLRHLFTLKEYPRLFIIIPFFTTLLKTISFFIIFNLATQHLDLSESLTLVLNKAIGIAIICTISLISFKLIAIAQELLVLHYSEKVRGTGVERKIFTQTLILKRVSYALISILTAGAILMLFDNVRTLGASVLTTAGVIGLVMTFTAQRSLSSLFSGLEIALTQHIKIGDKVFIENELGTVEEINFRSVVIKLWNWRRLIVPTSYFLEKSFQNLSHVEDTNLIGKVTLYVDFTMPVSKLRTKLTAILKETDLWDGQVNKIEISELGETNMQLKILVSAKNADDVSNLCALIREQLILYITTHFSAALPRARASSVSDEVKTGFDLNYQ